MEVEKRQAVESEDYDKAKGKKAQMDEYRLQVYKELNLNDLLELDGVSDLILAFPQFSILDLVQQFLKTELY